MIKRTIYIGNPAYLNVKDNQLLISKPGNDNHVGKASIEDVGILMLDHYQITITHHVMNQLLANNAAIITCDSHHMPHGLFLPLESNHIQSERFKHQINASVPLKKNLWMQTVVSKIHNQKCLLQSFGFSYKRLEVLASKVKSGDTENMEGRAASFYWKTLFDDFKRDRFGGPPNNVLNYGYAILRAIVARALVGSGLLPTLGIHHHNKYNAYCLADDVMEPFRPFVDRIVLDMLGESVDVSELSKEIKRRLLGIAETDVIMDDKKSPLMVAASQTTASLAECFSGNSRKLKYPEL